MTRTSQFKNDRGNTVTLVCAIVVALAMAFAAGLHIGASDDVSPKDMTNAFTEQDINRCYEYGHYDGDYLKLFIQAWMKAGYDASDCVTAEEYYGIRDKAEAKGEAADEAAYDREVAKAKAKITAAAEKAGAVTMGAKLNLALKYAHKHQDGTVSWHAAEKYYAGNFKADPEMGWPVEFADAYGLRYPDDERMPSAPKSGQGKPTPSPTSAPGPNWP